MEIPQHWRLNDQRYQPVETKSAYAFVGQGTVYSYTTVLDAPEGFESQAPYAVALVKLDEGPLVTAQLIDLDRPPEIGMRVEMVTRKLRTDGDAGIIIYGYKFRPPLVSAS